jgi:S-DNA-T family DNA segregation ATPase FtsK/SpoIIIE
VVPKVAERAPAPKPAPSALQGSLDLPTGTWRFPPLSLLAAPPTRRATGPSEEALQGNARMLETVLEDYGVRGQINQIRPGPVVTLYELEPAPGTKSARVIGLADDIARSMSVTAVRIATVPGRNVIGIEMPNAKRETVLLSELLGAEDWARNTGKLNLALGKDIGGAPVIADLARMPHLLIAGTTGSGKSVAVNTMILSLLYRHSPDECRFIMIDPKMLELSVYDRIPHLLAPVVTEPPKAIGALKWTVREMERRYRAMSQLGVRNIAGYNEKAQAARARGEVLTRRVQVGFDPETNKPLFEDQPLALEPLPMIVVIIDEVADLMMVAGKDIEAAVQRLAQMARAAGIHVIMATQRPSVDVITGTIKANFPTRISFQVTSKIDSRTILGEMGAEQLLGQGDMLYMAGGGRISRVHGPFVSDQEVEDVVAFLRDQGEPSYIDEVTEVEEDGDGDGPPGLLGGNTDAEGSLYDQAVALVTREGKASTSFVQRHLNIGYNRAAKLIEQMEKQGVVGAANHVGKREVLAPGPRD